MGCGGFALGVVLLVGSGAVAQSPDASTPAPQTSTITVQSNLVLVPTLVQDAKGGVLYGLKANQFVVKDNGVVQTVHVEDAAEASALSLVVVVQCSRSAEEQHDNLRGLPAMVEAMSGEAEQETAVVSFGTSPELLGPFSRSAARVHDVLKMYQPLRRRWRGLDLRRGRLCGETAGDPRPASAAGDSVDLGDAGPWQRDQAAGGDRETGAEQYCCRCGGVFAGEDAVAGRLK